MDAPDTLRSLLALAAQGATGRLAIPTPASQGSAQGSGGPRGELSLYLLDGALIATHDDDESRRLVQALVAQGHLAPARARQLADMSPQALEVLRRMGSDPIVGLLLEEVPEDALDAAFQTSFEDAVTRFVSAHTTPSFEPDALPWVDNVRMGHDTQGVVARLAGITPADADAIVRSLLGDVEELDSGSFEAEPDPDALEALDVFYEGEDAGDLPPATPEPEAADLPAPDDADADLSPEDPPTVDTEASANTLWAPDDNTETTQVPDDESEPEPEDVPEVAPIDALPTEEAPSDTPRAARGDIGLDDGDLEAFAGDERDGRGGGQDGTFVAQSEHLDAVDITGFDPDGRQPTLTAPTLSDHDARAKIGVTNDVLAATCAAFDGHRAGTGRRTLQVLVEGTPREFAALLHDIRLRDDGTLPAPRVIANARARPPAEQRRLLHDGLLDLLDRAFDRAADELEDDLLDALLEEVAGYRQRFGL